MRYRGWGQNQVKIYCYGGTVESSGDSFFNLEYMLSSMEFGIRNIIWLSKAFQKLIESHEYNVKDLPIAVKSFPKPSAIFIYFMANFICQVMNQLAISFLKINWRSHFKEKEILDVGYGAISFFNFGWVDIDIKLIR